MFRATLLISCIAIALISLNACTFPAAKRHAEIQSDTQSKEAAPITTEHSAQQNENKIYDIPPEVELWGIVIQQRIKESWHFPRAAIKDQLSTRVRVIISPEGSILDAKIVASSGRADFDASTLRAVADTKVLPKPPSPDISEITINFNSHE
ncbi:TonB C-terminal domain-containing protein [Desulfovibrio subterraneus]|uniref:TonB family protein n=1 Tax=Desulfovibrio subterraneus TaxID=2718620 RepID=A0A7J0BFD0_9BACT|nr:energy transducer TonB [Desulfovibrio subterraneus]WBF69192.1 TonB C-terminal domain-containing protein [Desulfovibrio subterraneus]GFM32248.1 hypothetical protein DSM101010T_06130 [Desulfovibrio subterraneus]